MPSPSPVLPVPHLPSVPLDLLEPSKAPEPPTLPLPLLYPVYLTSYVLYVSLVCIS